MINNYRNTTRLEKKTLNLPCSIPYGLEIKNLSELIYGKSKEVSKPNK